MSILRRFTDFVLQSRLQAMALAFICVYVPFGASVSILVAGLVTLRKGAFEGMLVILAATIPYALSYFQSTTHDSTNLELLAVYLFLGSNFLVWAFAVLLNKYASWSLIIEYATVCSIGAIGIVHLLYPDIQTWWAAQLTKYFAQTAAYAGISGSGELVTANIGPQVAILKRYILGLIVASMLINALLQLTLARWWQAIIFNPGGLGKELLQIRLSHVLGVIFIVGFGLSYWGNETVIDMMPVILSIFCIAGFSLFHGLLENTSRRWVWLFLLYIAAILTFPASVVLIAMAALLDVWLDFRKRFAKNRINGQF